MKDRFEFTRRIQVPLHAKPIVVHVLVQGANVTLQDADERPFARGVWDTGHYVRYPRSTEMPVHPIILDDIDGELRLRMTHRGVELRAEAQRRSDMQY